MPTPRYVVTLSSARISKTTGYPTLDDVAVACCRTPMFAGATREFYSVAHHCVAAARVAADCGEPPEVVLAVLLHEVEVVAYGDIPGPVKSDGQRGREMGLRSRFFASLGLPDLHQYWPRVEVYDKVEQAASVQVVGLAEEVHAAAWAAAPTFMRDRAAIRVRVTLHAFPPKDQLETDAPLASLFQKMVREGRDLIRPPAGGGTYMSAEFAVEWDFHAIGDSDDNIFGTANGRKEGEPKVIEPGFPCDASPDDIEFVGVEERETEQEADEQPGGDPDAPDEAFEAAVVRCEAELKEKGEAVYGGRGISDDPAGGFTHNGSDFYGSLRDCMAAVDRGEGIY
jgi:hypothetical protein